MACFASFASAQNNQTAPPEKPKTEKEAEKGAEEKTPQGEVPASGTPNQPSENFQNLSDGTKKATIVKTERAFFFDNVQKLLTKKATIVKNEPKKEKGNN